MKKLFKNIYLVIKYPFLKMNKTFLVTWQDYVPYGWQYIAMQLWGEIDKELKRFNGSKYKFHDIIYGSKLKIYDIKEKYGRLDIDYSFDGPSNIWDIINDLFLKYEYISERTCIDCGRRAKYVTGGWILPKCEYCLDEYGKAHAQEYYKDMKWYDYSKTFNK